MDSSIQSDPSSISSGAATDKVYAPLESLSIDGTSPQIGDSVEVTVKGTVESLEGDMACIKPESFNDSPAPQDNMEPNETSLRQNAQQLDSQGY